MVTLRTPDFSLGERARAFARGIPDMEPMVSLAREGFLREGVPESQKINYALRIIESESCGAGEIAFMLRGLVSSEIVSGPESGPYRGSAPSRGIPRHVQDRLCDSFLEKSHAAAGYLDMARREADGETARLLGAALFDCRMEKGALAYGLLKSMIIDSENARRSLARIFCLAGREILRGGAITGRDAVTVLEGIKNEYGNGRAAGLIPNGLSAFEAGFVLSEVSKSLCGADVSLP